MAEPAEFAAMPAPLRQLLDAELAAGNTIADSGHGPPAPPVGAWAKMARKISSPVPEGVRFVARNSAQWSGEYADAARHFFLLDPPLPDAGAYPDMDAIRAAHRAPETPIAALAARAPGEALLRALNAPMDHEQWHDGISHALDALEAATPEERAAVSASVIARSVDGWRDVRALVLLESPRADAALRRAFETGSVEVQGAVRRYAPRLLSEAERTTSLVRALREGELYAGLSQALDEVPDFHPPPVVEAVLRGCVERDATTAVHCAAVAMFLHGQAREPFDMAQRPFFLRFSTAEPKERRAAFRDLSARIGLDPAPYLRRRR